MFTNLPKIIKEYIHNRPKIKKAVGVILIILGLAALVTPLTPGSWLAFIGLELLGVRVLLSDKLTPLEIKRKLIIIIGRRLRFLTGLKFWKKK